MLVWFILIQILFFDSCWSEEKSPPKDDVVERICKSNPDFSFCKQYMAQSTIVPFPHLTEPNEGAKKKILLIKNEYNEDGTVKIPSNITLDTTNERELEQIKKVNHSSFQPTNNWGFEEAPKLKPDATLLPEPTPKNRSVDSEPDKEDFNFPLPEEVPRVEHIPLPQKLPDHRILPPDNNGLLSGIGDVNVGFGLGVGVPGVSDGVSVGSRVGVTLGASGLAGGVPYYFTNQGERFSLNDYDGSKTNIVPDRALKYYTSQVLLARKLAAERRQEVNVNGSPF
ncbi:hypothetical protein FO519_001008 [Halicephalobus sp. NKZ332]|nr:hypothetical protein FO519_001008 [Halicephalobus sp. NKZ332]